MAGFSAQLSKHPFVYGRYGDWNDDVPLVVPTRRIRLQLVVHRHGDQRNHRRSCSGVRLPRGKDAVNSFNPETLA